MLPAYNELDIKRDMYFNKSIIVERKSSLDELSSNLAQQRDCFENEFLRAGSCQKHLVIESGSYANIINHKYSTKLNERSFLASIMTFQQRYDIDVNFIEKAYTAQFMYGLFYYHLRESLRNE